MSSMTPPSSAPSMLPVIGPDPDGGDAFDSSLHVALITGAISLGAILLAVIGYLAFMSYRDDRLRTTGTLSQRSKTADRVIHIRRQLQEGERQQGVERKADEEGLADLAMA